MSPDQKQKPRLCLAGVLIVALLAGGCAKSRSPVAREGARHSPAASSSAPAPTAVYVVRAGETLGGIADCSGVSVEYLARVNGIADPNRIEVGARLRVPQRHRCPPANDAARAARLRAARQLSQAEARLDAADFEQALSLASACVDRLRPYSGDAEANVLRARCHFVAGTSATGLDDRDRAIAEFRRALVIDPDLAVPRDSSPRVRELVAEARSR